MCIVVFNKIEITKILNLIIKFNDNEFDNSFLHDLLNKNVEKN